MGKRIGFYVLSFLITLSLSVVIIPITAGAEGIEGLKFFGDVRARVESDSRTRLSGTAYQDQERDRFRYRLRAGFNYTASENVEIGGRLSSGDTNDANSPHNILGSKDNGDSTNDSSNYAFSRDTVSIDKAYVKGKYLDGFLWVGKNDIPFYEQNEYYWDGDVIPEGVGLGYTVKNLGPVSITLQGGYFIMKEGSWNQTGKGDVDSDMKTYQAVIKGGIELLDFTAAYGVASTSISAGTRIRSQAGASTVCTSATGCATSGAGTTPASEVSTHFIGDFSLTSLQVKVKAITDVPITLGYDMMKGSGDTIKDKDAGSVLNAGISFKDFSVLLMLPDIETNAVTGFAQDDWPNYYNNFKGTEARLGYKIAKNINVDFRYFSGERKTDTKQKEARNQINFNVSF